MPFVADAPVAVPSGGGFVPDEMAAAIGDPTGGAEQRKREQEAIAVRNQVRKEKSDFVIQNTEAGIPIKPDKELPAGLRMRLGAEPDPKVQAKMLTDQGMPARVSRDGKNVLVRQIGEDGTPEDVPLHPFGGVTLGTVAGEAVPIAKGLAGVGVAAATAPLSLPLAAGAMGLGAAAGEVLSTGGSRLASGQPLGDLGARVRDEAAINAGLPLAIGAAGKVAEGGRYLLARNPIELAKNAVEASGRTGIPLFPSQAADSDVLARGESMAGLKKLNAEQKGAIGASFDRQLGPSGPAGVLSESDLANKVQPIFQTDAEAAAKGARITMTDAEKAAQRELTAQLDAGLVPAGAGNTAVGQNTRKKFEDFVAKVKADAEVNYPAFHKQAEAEGITLDKKPITDLVDKITKEDPHGVADLLAPSVRQVKTVEQKLTQPLAEATPTGLLDASGKPIMTAEVPSPPLTFDEAIRSRAIVRQKLAAPDAALGDPVKTYYKQLEKAYTDSIDGALKKGSPELRKLYDTARGSYAAGADALERGVVQKLFRDAGEAGRVPDENVVTQIFSGTGKLEALRDMKNILGATSPDYKLLIRQGVQNMIDDAASKGTGGLIKVDAFLSRFNALSPEMRAEMFGPLEAPLKATADAMAIAQKGAPGAAKIPAEELADALLASPRSVKDLIERGVARQKAYEADYTNSLMQKLSGRTLGIKDLGNLDKFTESFVPQASAADMRQILTRIEAAQPGSAEQLRQRVLANIRDDVNAAKGTVEAFDPKPEAIRQYTRGKEAEKYRAILGDKGVQFLEDLATIAESNALRIERGTKESVTPRVFGKEALSGGAGFVRNAISTGVDLASILPRAIIGNAERLASVRNFLLTGKLPSLGAPAKTAILAASPAIETTANILADTKNERMGALATPSRPTEPQLLALDDKARAKAIDDTLRALPAADQLTYWKKLSPQVLTKATRDEVTRLQGANVQDTVPAP